MLHRELDVLRTQMADAIVQPQVEVHPHAEVTTAFDIVLNRLRELSRGSGRHGSCGMGINDTITRKLAGFSLTVEDLTDERFWKKLQHTYKNYWKIELGKFNSSDPEVEKLLDAVDLLNEGQSLRAAAEVFSKITPRPRSDDKQFVFEGAQGLQLDEFLGKFPHVTRSVTGLPTALLAAREVGVQELSPVYVTRCYKTRHGAGHLLHEGEKFSSTEIVDATNVTGEWQGHFRYAPLDTRVLQQFIEADLQRSKPLAELLGIKINAPSLAVTCFDQVSADFSFYDDRGGWQQSAEALIQTLDRFLPVKYVSYGPSANHINEIDSSHRAGVRRECA